MKSKFILSIAVVLIAGVFVANGIYGSKIATKIETQLNEKMAKNELPVAIVYSKIKVNPLFSKVNIADVSVADIGGNVTFKCEDLNIDISYDEALRLAESTEFEEVNSLKLTFIESEFHVAESKILVKLKDLSIDFDGHLSKADFEQLNSDFPDTKQELEFSFSGMKVTLPDGYAGIPPFSALQEQFSEIDRGNCNMVFLPATHELNIEDFTVESPVISYKGSTRFNYSGNGLNDFRMQMAKMNAELRLQPKDINWDDKNGGEGEFSLKNFNLQTNSQVHFDKNSLPEGEMKLVVEKLKINYNDKQNSSRGGLLNLSVKDFDVDKLEVNYKLTDTKLELTDTKIKSSLMDATVFADVNMNASNPANSDINKAEIKVEHLTADLATMLNAFEQQMGKELPRENGVIILELSGKLGSPKIKGFEF